MMPFLRVCNNLLDKLVRPEIRALQKTWQVYQVCGYTGFGLAIVLTISLVAYLNLSPLVMGAITLLTALVFFGLVMASKIVTGEEQIVYYHHEIAVLLATTLLLRLLKQPVLPYLDLTVLGIGLFLACGRIGCLMAGCCHGRPYRWGVSYRPEHAEAGFTPWYVGVRLFPIQAVESGLVLGVVLVGTILVRRGAAPGTVLAWYTISYGMVRFVLEFWRGDPERPYLWGFSEAQWISLALMGLIAAAELSGALPLAPWHIGATAAVLGTMMALGLTRRFQENARYRLLQPRHVAEIAAAVACEGCVRNQNCSQDQVRLRCTSQGVQISGGAIASGAGSVRHYAISSRDGDMTEKTARVLSRLILQLGRASGSSEFFKGNRQHVFHLLIYP
ncbi:MAG: prolipoprotein diacylglyceryl transferase [Deltaproteobacteria bacterium]|jgi:hypothetical protein